MKILYTNLSKETISRINIVDDIEKFDLTKIKRGLLSFHARWSDKSVIHGREILKLIDGSELKDFGMYIVDIDTISPEKQIELIGKACHGYFESVWIENGKIEFNYRSGHRRTELSELLAYLKGKLNS